MSRNTADDGSDQAFEVPSRNEDLANRIHELAKSDRIRWVTGLNAGLS